ncbi:MAG: DUF1800 domain-containing protein [Planctomycetes bacterium]|nr:DUF1800 domain-containing protein [Planctomycetota bacterium]
MTDLMAPWQPTAADPFDLAKVGHLLRRAGFGGSLFLRRELEQAGVAAALARIAGSGVTAVDEELLQDAIAFGDIGRVRAFRVWLALHAEQPLQQRMSLFWHGHFATGNQKLNDPRAMALQLATFDRLGQGRCDDLVLAMCRDPALLRWLDNDVNTKAKPNENFARELFELFTLGRGHYSEADIREAARCFTGWHVRDGSFFFQARLHDDGEKTVFGTRGRMDGGDVVALAMARRESAEFFADRWLRFFVHPEPEPAEVTALAAVYERSGRDVRTTILTLLASRLFFSPRALRSKVKRPADFVLGLVRALGARAAPTELAATMATLGETWCEPPSVEGWHGERAWLSPASWLLRSNFVADLLGGRIGKLAPGAEQLFVRAKKPADYARIAGLVLLDGVVAKADADRIADVAAAHLGDPVEAARAVLHAATCLPEYQLS